VDLSVIYKVKLCLVSAIPAYPGAIADLSTVPYISVLRAEI